MNQVGLISVALLNISIEEETYEGFGGDRCPRGWVVIVEGRHANVFSAALDADQGPVVARDHEGQESGLCVGDPPRQFTPRLVRRLAHLDDVFRVEDDCRWQSNKHRM